ncbi:zinc finger MYM-type protein 1-like [Daktulosphaira vitifoliae]|uniref:zinc finger MYM-type protein 1-like n=1 Tax=Daktulosphaira vitifoliae TaxID=58002 RepID=UPI0021AA04A9|nr:zinc finger MYM-type protein 1-like [Daktulosphaira vitifoliae]
MDINMKKTDFQVSDSETTIISESIEVDNVEPEGSCESNELTNMIVNETILEIDPAKWVINDEFRDYIAKNGFNQNMTNDFINSKRIYSDKTRYLTKIMFNRRLINGETIVRSWLVYSPSLGVVFCGPCRIFQTSLETQLVTEGFNDWKNATVRFSYHENSKEHRDAIMNLKHRGNVLGRIDNSLIKQLDTEIEYWRNVLKRVVETIKSLASRGLPFRGHDSCFGSVHNGNYLMSLELIAKFDPFLADHIVRFGSKGSGSTSYLSHVICDEFIFIDSTPDISHVDKLSFMVRYVLATGLPVERFLCFVSNPGHKALDLTNVIINTLKSHDIDISDCRGQSYDNASNMSGQYSGVQARIKEINPLRWSILQLNMKRNANTIKSLSNTRWSARADACRALYNSWDEIINALITIKDDTFEKCVTRNESNGLYNQMQKLETSFMMIFWNHILERFNASNKQLQCVEIGNDKVSQIYTSLINLVQKTRDNFDEYETRAKKISKTTEYNFGISRQKKKKLHFDEKTEQPTELIGRDKFRVETFYVIIDKMTNELKKRQQAFKAFCDIFEVLLKITSLNSLEIVKFAEKLQKMYPNDLDNTFSSECLHLQSYLLNSDIDIDVNNLTPITLCQYLREKSLHIEIFPNIDTALRIFVSVPVSNCTTERSFSCLKRVKNYLRSTQTDDKLNNLALFSIENEMLSELNCEDLIDTFARTKCRRKPIV